MHDVHGVHADAGLDVGGLLHLLGLLVVLQGDHLVGRGHRLALHTVFLQVWSISIRIFGTSKGNFKHHFYFPGVYLLTIVITDFRSLSLLLSFFYTHCF